MRCIDVNRPAMRSRLGLSALLGALGVLLVAGCATQAPTPIPTLEPAVVVPPLLPEPQLSAPPAPEPPPPPPPAPLTAARPPVKVDLGPRVALPAAPGVRNWDEFRKMAARRMVAASPKGSYMSTPQPLLFGIPVMEVELNADGSIRDIAVTRAPSNIDAQDTIDHAIEAIRRGAPYGDISRLPRPWRFTEVFLFNNKRQFKPRSLD